MFDSGAFLGHYLPFNSLVHRLDPRTKIFILTVWGILIFLIDKPLSYLWLFVAVVTIFGIASIPIGHVFRGLRPMLVFIFITILLNLFFIPGKALASIGPLTVTVEGVTQSVVMGGRLLVLLLLTMCFTSTTSPLEVTSGLELLLAPFGRLRFPVGEFALMMAIALRFIPTFFEELQRIVKAQQARGANFEDKNFFKCLKPLLSVCIPLFYSAFRRAHELGVAIEARGFIPGVKRSRYREFKFGFRDFIAVIISFALFTAIR